LLRLRPEDGMSALASTRETAFGEVELRFPFADSESLREALKSEIPGRYRRWDPDERVWRIMGAYRETAIALLLEHFPRAEVPDDALRRVPSSPARTVPPPLAPLPPIPFPASPETDDQPARLVACVRCPRCHERYDQPVRVSAVSSQTIAKQERPPAEFVSVCPTCNTLAIVSFCPAPAALQEASA
jgi:hypothetical protein